jgi:hypothetical protein
MALLRDAAAVTAIRVRFEGPSMLALQVARELADADGIELIASESPAPLDEGKVELTVVVDATEEAVGDAVAKISETLPEGSSLATVGG